MSGLSPHRRTLRATKARLTQLGADTSTVDGALKEARVAEYIERVVSEAPPLSVEQRDRLASLLRPARASDGAA